MPDFALEGKEPNCQQTLLVIKPDAVRRRLVGEIIRRVEGDHFRICDVRFTRLERSRAEEFYAIHQSKEFFAGLVEFMTSGPVLALRLEREDAVRRLRELAGATDPKQARPRHHPRRLRNDYPRKRDSCFASGRKPGAGDSVLFRQSSLSRFSEEDKSDGQEAVQVTQGG